MNANVIRIGMFMQIRYVTVLQTATIVRFLSPVGFFLSRRGACGWDQLAVVYLRL